MAETQKEASKNLDKVKILKDKCRLYELGFHILCFEVTHRISYEGYEEIETPYFPEMEDYYGAKNGELKAYLTEKSFTEEEIEVFEAILHLKQDRHNPDEDAKGDNKELESSLLKWLLWNKIGWR